MYVVLNPPGDRRELGVRRGVGVLRVTVSTFFFEYAPNILRYGAAAAEAKGWSNTGAQVSPGMNRRKRDTRRNQGSAG